MMKNHTVVKKAVAAALLSATLAAPAAVLTAGTAAAKPIESPNCRGIALAIESSMYMSDRARDQGDTKAAREHMLDAVRASRNYQRHCVS
jgi:hypothetical protein